MASDKKQLTLVVIAAGLFAAVMLTGVVGNIVRGNYLAAPLIALALIAAFVLIWIAVRVNQRRIQMMFRQPTPDRVIDHYHATLVQARARKVPHAEATTAYLSALAATVYGQFDRAREELSAVEWEQVPPMYRGHRLHLLALMELLENHDAASALRLASEAQALERTDPAGGLQIFHDAIQVAAGEGDAEAVKRCQRTADRGAGAMPALCAWALSLYLERDGRSKEADRYRERVRETVPGFVGLKSRA